MLWQHIEHTTWQLTDGQNKLIAMVGKTDTGTWEIRVRNRSDGWTFAYASSKTTAQRKALALIRREAA